MTDDNFPAVEISGLPIDFDNLHMKVDAVTAGSVAVTAGTVKVTSGTINLGTVIVNNADLTTIEYGHEKIHDGLMFTSSYFAGSIADGGTVCFSMRSGTTPPHLFTHVSSIGNARLRIVQGGTLEGFGTALSFNRYRAGTATPLAACLSAGTLSGGSALYDTFIAGGNKNFSVGGENRAQAEFILPVSATVVCEAINLHGAAGTVSFHFDWYEEAV
jgi:hypothetical protein